MKNFQVEAGFPPPPDCYRSVCEACGCGDRPGVRVVRLSSIQIDHDDAFYVPLWVCEMCVWEWAHALGMLTVDESNTLRAANDTLRSQLDEAETKLASLEAVRAALEAFAPVVQEEGATKEPCPECGKPFKPQGMNLHRRQAHGFGK